MWCKSHRHWTLEQLHYMVPKAVRAYNNALILSAMGIPTAKPIAYILEKKNMLLTHSYLITEQLNLKHTLYEFGRGDINNREELFKSFAYFTAEMLSKGVLSVNTVHRCKLGLFCAQW